MEDAASTLDLGYAKAKLVCERIIEKTMKRHQDTIEATIVRLGQIAGDENNGYWNTNEHFAALIKSSQAIGKLPEIKGTFSWLPVDAAARALSELTFTHNEPVLVCHLENPMRQAWSDCLQVVSAEIGLSDAERVPFRDWLNEVRFASTEDNPASRLIEFLERDFSHMSCGTVALNTKMMKAFCPSVAEFSTLSLATIRGYISYWRESGYLR